jgi:glycosyltransferase involved in cell wall biosynthesis
VVVAVGRLSPQKDFATLLDALARLPGHPAPRLIILGEGAGRPALAARIVAAGLGARVDLVGQVPDVLPYLARADLYVQSSRWEGFGIALVEALGCGVPVVATDCPVGPAEVLQQGRLGRLVPVADPEALARAMAAALADPADRGAGMVAALAYDDGRAAEAHLRLGRRLLGARRS